MSTKKKTKKTAAKRKPGAGAKATAEEQAKGVPANGYVVLFRVFTQAEHNALVKHKKAIAEKAGIKATWPEVVKYAMAQAA